MVFLRPQQGAAHSRAIDHFENATEDEAMRNETQLKTRVGRTQLLTIEAEMTTALEIDEALLDAFIGDGSITEVLYVVRSGKEATVYCCRGAGGESGRGESVPSFQRRNFHNDAIYQVGRDAAYEQPRQTRIGEETRAWTRSSVWNLD